MPDVVDGDRKDTAAAEAGRVWTTAVKGQWRSIKFNVFDTLSLLKYSLQKLKVGHICQWLGCRWSFAVGLSMPCARFVVDR